MMKEQNLKKNMLWNASGNLLFLGCQWLITILVTNIGHFRDAGILSLAMSISATFQTLAAFGIRNFQVSDMAEKYTDTQYVSFRLITCSAAFVFCAVFSIAGGYYLEQLTAIALFMLFRLSENFSDVLHGIVQKNGRLDLAGKSYAIRGLGTLTAFIIPYSLGSGLNAALALMAAFSWAVTLLFDVRVSKKLSTFSLWQKRISLFSLAKETLPLCVYLFFSAAMATVPKLVLEKQLGEETLGVYSSIFAPALLISSAASYLYSPFVPIFAEKRSKRDNGAFTRLFIKITLAISAFAVIAILAAHFFGDFALKLLFGEKILGYSYLLIPILLSIFVSAVFTFLATLEVVLRDFLGLLVSCGAALAFELFVTGKWIELVGINATSYSYISACAIAGIILFFRMLMKLYGKKSKGD